MANKAWSFILPHVAVATLRLPTPIHNPVRKEKPELCSNCHKREATVDWVGTGGALDYVHGNYTRWCEVCVTKAQLRYAKEGARDIPRLESKLKKLLNGNA